LEKEKVSKKKSTDTDVSLKWGFSFMRENPDGESIERTTYLIHFFGKGKSKQKEIDGY
jgi:hypothetical protein